jgi:hypothetical protein
MAKFNFVDAAAKGYKFIWNERRMLLHYGFWPLILKISSFSVIAALGYEKNLLRQGLILLPAYFLEAWLVAIAVRFALFGERSPEPLNAASGTNTPQAREARRAIMAGVLIYLMIKLFSSFTGGIIMDITADAPKEPSPVTAGMYFAMLVVTAIMVWAFRFFWIYVPAMMGMRISHFLRLIQGFNSSLYIIGLWMICVMPALLILLAGSKILMLLFPGTSGMGPVIYMQLFAALQAFVEMIVALASSVAFGYAIMDMISSKNSKQKIR